MDNQTVNHIIDNIYTDKVDILQIYSLFSESKVSYLDFISLANSFTKYKTYHLSKVINFCPELIRKEKMLEIIPEDRILLLVNSIDLYFTLPEFKTMIQDGYTKHKDLIESKRLCFNNLKHLKQSEIIELSCFLRDNYPNLSIDIRNKNESYCFFKLFKHRTEIGLSNFTFDRLKVNQHFLKHIGVNKNGDFIVITKYCKNSNARLNTFGQSLIFTRIILFDNTLSELSDIFYNIPSYFIDKYDYYSSRFTLRLGYTKEEVTQYEGVGYGTPDYIKQTWFNLWINLLFLKEDFELKPQLLDLLVSIEHPDKSILLECLKSKGLLK